MNMYVLLVPSKAFFPPSATCHSQHTGKHFQAQSSWFGSLCNLFQEDRGKAKQKEIQTRKVLFSYARHAFIVELPLLLFFCSLVCFVLLWKIIRSRRKRPWSYRSLGWNWLPNTYHLLEVRASMDILRRVSKNHPSRKPQGVRLDCDDGSHRHSTKTCVKSSIHVGNSEMLTWYPTYYLIPWGRSLWRLIYVVDLTSKKCLGP